MGFYINKNTKGEDIPTFGKERFLVEDGAMPILEPIGWEEGLVCIITNLKFEAAGYAFSPKELQRMKGRDGRLKSWVIYRSAAEISGFKK